MLQGGKLAYRGDFSTGKEAALAYDNDQRQRYESGRQKRQPTYNFPRQGELGVGLSTANVPIVVSTHNLSSGIEPPLNTPKSGAHPPMFFRNTVQCPAGCLVVTCWWLLDLQYVPSKELQLR
jgi:hypothetical protein